MYIIALFGVLMVLFSAVMVINPEYWSNGIVRFSEKAYFHPVEILSRLGFGVIFIVYSEQTLFPDVMLGIGYLLAAVGSGLLITPPSRHRRFAVWSVRKFKRTFRPAGVISLAFGAFIVYAALRGSGT
ncbi:hypothetical protein [Rhodocaloribacter sp.]